MRDPLGRWLARRSDDTVAAVQAASVAVLAWLGAALSVWLTGKTESQFAVVSLAGILVVAVVSFVARAIVRLRTDFTSSRAEAIAFVHSQLDGLVSKEQRCVETKDRIIDIPGSPLVNIENLIQSLYELFDAKYQDDSVPGERIYIETCFMTRSYKDNRITISAWANNDGRKPTSLSIRPSQPDIYDRTITADLYRESAKKRPEPRLIEDTASDPNYVHLYPTQHQRIKSTIVYPVLSTSSQLLGALVATADRPSYFRSSDRAYWYSIMDLYERRLGLEFLRLDVAVKEGRLPEPF